MKNGFIRVAAITPKMRVADPFYNVKELVTSARQATKDGVSLLVFPELCLTGYTCADLFFQESLLKATEKALSLYIEETRMRPLLSFVGIPVSFNDKLYNCAAVVFEGKLLGLVPKTHLPNYREFYELRHFTEAPSEPYAIFFAGQNTTLDAGQLFVSAFCPSFRVGCEICEDLWAPNPTNTHLATSGATIIVNLSASDEVIGKCEYRKTLVSSTSARLLTAYVYADAGEGESGTDMVFSAHNMIAENGTILKEARPFAEENYITAVIDTEKLVAERRLNTTFTSTPSGCRVTTFSLPLSETKLDTPPSKTPFVPEDTSLCQERCELILTIQARGLAGRIERSRSQGVVIGLSGGLDSTLALLVAISAVDYLSLPRMTITAVTMPCFGTTDRTKNNAEKLAEALGITLLTVDIHDAVIRHFKDIGHPENLYNTTYENAQARERTQVLMDLANAKNALVVGTGDLSELALGFATYNGDHMSMYGVNASVPKTLVRHLVAFYADKAKDTGSTALSAILNDVLATPVSPELLPPENGEIAQCTEKIVGPYILHDYFLYYFVRFAFTPQKIFRLAQLSFKDIYSPEEIRRWLTLFLNRFFSQQFKRSCLPDGPKVGSVVLSPRADWRMPSDASVEAWLNDLL